MGRHFVDSNLVVDSNVVADGDVVVDGDSSSLLSLSSWTPMLNRYSALASRVRGSRAPFVEVAAVEAMFSQLRTSDGGGGETEMETTIC